MALTKQNWLDLMKDYLAGGDMPSELRSVYHPRIIEKYLGLAFDALLNRNNTKKDDLRDELGMDNWKYDALTKPFFAEILYDSKRKRYYSDLPKTVLSINNNNGVRMVCPVEEEQTQFLPRRFEDIFLMNDLDVGQLTGLIFYTVEGINRIYYSGEINSCWKEVMLKLALGFDELEYDDVVTIPDGKDAEVFDMVRSIMATKLPQDISDDSTAQQTTK